MKVLTHQEVEGVDAGVVIDVTEERAEWLLLYGYASKVEEEPDQPEPEAPKARKRAG